MRPLDFPTLLDEAAGAFTARVGDVELVVAPPSSDTVCDLDTRGPAGQLALLAGDQAEQVLGELDPAPAHELCDLVADIRAHFGILVPPPEGAFDHLVEQVDLYGEHIEHDLLTHTHQLSLHLFVREHLAWPWAVLLRVLEHLPAGCHYRAAQAQDLVLAQDIDRAVAAGEVARPTGAPSLVGWTEERENQVAILETLRRIEHGIWAASPKFKGKGGEPPAPLPRPRTARDTVRERALLARHDTIASQLLGARHRPHAPRVPAPEAVRGAVLLDPPDWR